MKIISPAAPVHDGIDLLLIMRTYDEGLPTYYGVQQCFRMSGRTNAAWRRAIACAPSFSEYDLWATEEGEAERTRLTYVVRNGLWQELPVLLTAVGTNAPWNNHRSS